MASCGRCGNEIAAGLEVEGVCADCLSQDAWRLYENRTLRIDRQTIRAAASRLEREARGPGVLGLLPAVPAAVALLLGAAAALKGSGLLRSRSIGPLATLREGLLVPAREATWLGIAAIVIGLTGLICLRRSRLFRALPLYVIGLLGLLSGAFFTVVGALFWSSTSIGFGWDHVEVPSPIPELGFPADRIARATAVVLAPDADGDARGLGVGSGAVIHTTRDRAWIVTCRHVAMPYLSTSSVVDLAKVHPVWVYLSDGRNRSGRVVWAAPPPLDVAVVVVRLRDPPAAVSVHRSAESIQSGEPVVFVPNPLREGWLSSRGQVLHRVPHETPAGRYGLIYTDLPVQPGDSGSGLYLEDGRLVGLNAMRGDGPGGPFAIGLPSEAMAAILEQLAAGDLVRSRGREGGDR